MSVYDLQNVTIEPVSSGGIVLGYTITANEGYYIHLPQHEELSYTTIVMLRAAYDFSTVQVVHESEVPEGAEIHGNGNDNEIMSAEETDLI